MNLRMARAGMLGSYDKEESLLTVSWSVTGHCPYHCSYCYDKDSQKRKFDPTLEELLSALPKLAQIVPANQNLCIRLFGGEPTAHRHFLPLVKHIRQQFPDATISCLSNLFQNLSFLQQLYSIAPEFTYNVSIHFEHLSENIWEKIDFLAKQKRKGDIILQFLPSARDAVYNFARRMQDTYPELTLKIQFLRSRESNFRRHFADYTEEDYSWARQVEQQHKLPPFFIDYTDEDHPGKIFRRTYTFMEAFHAELSSFRGSHCTYSMKKLDIMLNGNLRPGFCVSITGRESENIYKDTSWPNTIAALRKPVICRHDPCTCFDMRCAAKWFDPRFAPLYLGGDPALAHDTVTCEELALPS